MIRQSSHWNVVQKTTLQEINLGPGYYAYNDLKRCEKISNAAYLLRVIKVSGLENCVFYKMQRIQEEWKFSEVYCINKYRVFLG